jgi:predicted anti-sigma-YlaC factor YlaD
MARIDRYTCQETFERLNDYLDRELTPEETRLVIEHLEVCAFCAPEFEFEARLLQEVRAKLHAIPAPPSLLDKVRDALAHAQSETGSDEAP